MRNKINKKFSIIILTFNRKDWIAKQIKLFLELKYKDLEIIIVDNNSDETLDELVVLDPRIVLIRNSENLGAVGRNHGMERATGDILITLDDDVYGISDDKLHKISNIFDTDQDIAAVSFKIIEEGTKRQINWVHPYDQATYADRQVETHEISEGAVALRRRAIKEVGLYPEYFFISHEGPDLALRLINKGWKVMYTPEMVVTHAYEQQSRKSWRRYYYDTRNQLWLVLRNLTFWYGLKRLTIGWGSMFIYSLRDGYIRYWFKAVFDAICGAPRAWRDRCPPTPKAAARWRQIEQHKPGFWHMVRKRLFAREVRI